MSHPLLEDLTVLSEADLQERLSSISTKYWQTQNPDVRSQMMVIIDELKYELRLRLPSTPPVVIVSFRKTTPPKSARIGVKAPNAAV